VSLLSEMKGGEGHNSFLRWEMQELPIAQAWGLLPIPVKWTTTVRVSGLN